MIDKTDISGFRSPVSRLSLGTAGFGSIVPTDDAFSILDAYAEAGGNFLDTANCYAAWLPDGKGRSERTIGSWLKSRGMRSRMPVATKGGHPDFETRRSRLDEASLDHDLTESLDRLGLDFVDAYWFHRDDPARPLEEILGWAARQIASGRIGAIGCSNWSLKRVRRSAESAMPARFFANQIGWSLADRKPPSEYPDLVFMNEAIHAFHRASALPVFAYSAQANGFFAPHKRGNATPAAYASPANEARRLAVDALAARRGVSQNQVALAWLWSHPFPVVPIIGPRTAGQLQDSLRALDIRFSAAELAALSG